MRTWTIQQLKSYMHAHDIPIPGRYPGLKEKHYRWLLADAAKRGSK